MNRINGGFLSPSDIAEIAGVTRAAVSNWRERDPEGFPKPVSGDGANPLFSAEEVFSWLKSRGTEPRLDSDTAIWSVANSMRGRAGFDSLDLVVLLIASGATTDEITSRVPVLTAADVDALRRPIEAVDKNSLPLVIDQILERISRWQGRGGGEHGSVNSRISQLLANLAIDQAPSTVYDPAVGIGAALVQIASELPALQLATGQDVSETALEIARLRFRIRGLNVHLDHPADVLLQDPNPALKADVVIAEPPLGLRVDLDGAILDPRFEFGLPSRLSADSAWLQHAIYHLAEGGRGFVITTLGALNRRGAEQKIRAEMLKKGAVEAVIQLPNKMLQTTHIQTALWVLKRPSGGPSRGVLLIDATNEQAPEADAVNWLKSEDERANVPHVTIPISDLVDEGDLLPGSWVARANMEAADYSGALIEAISELKKTSALISWQVADLESLNVSPGSTQRSLEELQRAGIIDVLPTSYFKQKFVAQPKSSSDQLVKTGDVRRGTFPPASLNSATVDERSQSGDVFVSTLGSVHGLVDSQGGHVPGPEVWVIRVLNQGVLNPFYLAFALSGQGQRAVGTTIPRYPVATLTIPIVPIAEQNKIAGFTSRLTAARIENDRLSAAFEAATENLRSALLKGESIVI